MTDAVKIQRQWVSLPHGSCDVRVGPGATGAVSQALRTGTSVRTRCLLLVEAHATPEWVEEVRRELVDAGNDVTITDIDATAEGLGDAQALFDTLAEVRATSDDLLFALGGIRVLSLAAYVAGAWCGGMRLALMPTDEDALLESVVAPRWLSCAGEPEMVGVEPSAKHAFADLGHMDCDLGSEPSLLARALMVATAVAESEKSFSKLWDAADDLMAGDQDMLATALCDALKSRGHLASSSSLAIRQSLLYGLDFLRALRTCVPGAPDSTLLAEGLRLAARISCGMGKLSMDDVFAQDDLLEALGLPDLVADIEPERLLGAMREERFRRSNRLMITLPQALGRVRLASVDDDLLREHVTAWCDAHRP